MRYEYIPKFKKDGMRFIYFTDAVRKEAFPNEDFRYLCDTMGLDIDGNLVKKLPEGTIVEDDTNW